MGEASRDGNLVFELGRIPAGTSHILFLHLQVNPTNVGRRSQTVRLEALGEPTLTVERTLTVFP